VPCWRFFDWLFPGYYAMSSRRLLTRIASYEICVKGIHRRCYRSGINLSPLCCIPIKERRWWCNRVAPDWISKVLFDQFSWWRKWCRRRSHFSLIIPVSWCRRRRRRRRRNHRTLIIPVRRRSNRVLRCPVVPGIQVLFYSLDRS